MIPRARISLWTENGVQLSTYTCLVVDAHSNAGKDLAGSGPGCYVTVSHLDGSVWYQIEHPDEITCVRLSFGNHIKVREGFGR